MKEHVLIKENVFTCVMFGAIFLFVLSESIFKSDALSIIAFIIAIPLFVLSLIQLVINVLERINDKITSFLASTENQNIPSRKDLTKIRNCEEATLISVIKDISEAYPNKEWISSDLSNYFYARKTRSSIRATRRKMLYVYYAICMIILLLLLLHTEAYTFLQNSEWITTINMDLFEVWSLIIILFEIMMKDIVEDIIICIIDKRMGINLEYY